MFEVGFTEIILILGLALLVLGPEKLPGLAEKIGRWTGRARSMARQLRMQLEQEVTLEEMAKSRPMQSGPAKQPEATTSTDSSAEHRTGPQEPWAQGTDAVHTAEAQAAEVHPAEVHPAEVHPAEQHPEASPHPGIHATERPVEAAAAHVGTDRATTKAGQ
jgi:sec-independent protein translocase protein TatB